LHAENKAQKIVLTYFEIIRNEGYRALNDFNKPQIGLFQCTTAPQSVLKMQSLAQNCSFPKISKEKLPKTFNIKGKTKQFFEYVQECFKLIHLTSTS
jgi:hypothetical protein